MTQVNFYSKEQIDEREIGEPTDSASSTGSLWARLKNAVSRIVSLETADTNNVKKTGTSTVTGTLEVPTTPPTPTSVVNSVYVNDATAGVNNLMHKTGNESFSGEKTAEGTVSYPRRTKRTDLDITDVTSTTFIGQDILDKNGTRIASFNHVFRANGEREMQFSIGDSSLNAVLILNITANGNTVFKIQKTVNGTTTSSNIATL